MLLERSLKNKYKPIGTVFLFIVLIPILLKTNSMYAQAWNQWGTDIDGDVSFAELGTSVSVSADGLTIAISDHSYSDSIFQCGRARIYLWDGTDWLPKGDFITGNEQYELFGTKIDLSSDGNIVAIYAPNDYINPKVKVYSWNDTNWQQMGQNISNVYPNSSFGNAISISGDGTKIAIGARAYDSLGFTIGKAYIFDWNGVDWIQIGSAIDGSNTGEYFGYDLDLDYTGSTVVIGAPSTTDSCFVGVYQRFVSQWNQMGDYLTGQVIGDVFGNSVSISDDGTVIAIGAPDYNGSLAGYAAIYNKSNNLWVLDNYIEEPAPQESLGYTVNLNGSGTRIAVSAPLSFWSGVDMRKGRVRIYDKIAAQWVQSVDDIWGENISDRSGTSMRLSSNGQTVIIGAISNADGAGIRSGHARVYASDMADLDNKERSFPCFIYPNPVESILTINLPLDKCCTIKKAAIYNLLGELICTDLGSFKPIGNTVSIDVRNFSSGIYLIILEDEHRTVVKQRFIKK